jgi:hypothetical protein
MPNTENSQSLWWVISPVYYTVPVRAYAASSLFAFILQPYAWTLPSDSAERGRLVICLAPAAVSLHAQPPMYSTVDCSTVD